MNFSHARENRLSILYLMCVSAGVGIAMSVTRGIERLRFPADAIYYQLDGIHGIGARDALTAGVYGGVPDDICIRI